MASSPTASRPAPENPQPVVAAWQIARLRAALDWMLCHPDWEGGIALSIAGLGLQGRRQGITGRKAALSLPIQHKCEAVRHALSSGLEAPRLEEALKLARLWGLTSFRAPSGLTQLPRKRWETLSGALLLRVAARASDYKRAQNALYAEHSDLVTSCAFALCGDLGKLDDAKQEGRLALLQAIDRIDPQQPFAAYARHWINRGIKNFLMQERLPVRVPINLLSQALRDAKTGLSSCPESAQLRAALIEGTLSLDHDGFENAQACELSSNPAESPASAALLADEHALLCGALRDLTTKQREVLTLRFGLSERAGGQSLSQIAAKAGISRQQVFQREKRAMQKLAGSLGELKLERTES